MANREIASKKLVWVLSLLILGLLPSRAGGQTETVKLGDLAAISNAPIYIAIEKGFFKEQSVNVEISNFASAAKMVPALVVGELLVVGQTMAEVPEQAAHHGDTHDQAGHGESQADFDEVQHDQSLTRACTGVMPFLGQSAGS